jgi:hypothetical protein
MAAWEGHSDAGDRETELDELLYDPLGSAMRR